MHVCEKLVLLCNTHLMVGGQSQVSHGGQISEQFSQLTDNNREYVSRRTSDKKGLSEYGENT